MGTTTDYKEKYLKSFFDWQNAYENACQREKKLEEKLKIAKEALEFYANKENNYYSNTVWEDWENDEFATVNGDIENGYRAREALKQIRDNNYEK